MTPSAARPLPEPNGAPPPLGEERLALAEAAMELHRRCAELDHLDDDGWAARLMAAVDIALDRVHEAVRDAGAERPRRP